MISIWRFTGVSWSIRQLNRWIDFVGLLCLIYVSKKVPVWKCCLLLFSVSFSSFYIENDWQLQLLVNCCTFQNPRNPSKRSKPPWPAPPLGWQRSEVICHIYVLRCSVHVLYISLWPNWDTSRILTDEYSKSNKYLRSIKNQRGRIKIQPPSTFQPPKVPPSHLEKKNKKLEECSLVLFDWLHWERRLQPEQQQIKEAGTGRGGWGEDFCLSRHTHAALWRGLKSQNE